MMEDNAKQQVTTPYGEMHEKMAQEKLRAMHATVPAGSGATLGYEAQQPMRENIVQRFRSRLERSRRESNKAARLEELVYLLDKNPEVARILELVDLVGSDY